MTNVVNKVVFKRAINFFIFAVAITIIATLITYIINPDVKEVMEVWEGIGDSSSGQIKESTGIEKVWSYVAHNGFEVPLQMFILALIPIQFLYFINIITTTTLVGFVFGFLLQANFVKGFELIISSIPHSIFEIFAYCLLAAVLFELNQVVRVKLRNMLKKAKEGNSLIKKFLMTIRTYVVFVLPIIIVAAFLETYIADTILNLFQ
ncbi:stage II sporulation protein M [Aneurinibacillus sp. BA2021]|nr:stage II sporulation protein M [Aneurinibacillus sp. BA2021]